MKFLRSAAIQKFGDIRMVKTRQYLFFYMKTLDPPIRISVWSYKFNRDFLPELVISARSQVDRAHTAISNLTKDLVRTYASCNRFLLQKLQTILDDPGYCCIDFTGFVVK